MVSLTFVGFSAQPLNIDYIVHKGEWTGKHRKMPGAYKNVRDHTSETERESVSGHWTISHCGAQYLSLYNTKERKRPPYCMFVSIMCVNNSLCTLLLWVCVCVCEWAVRLVSRIKCRNHYRHTKMKKMFFKGPICYKVRFVIFFLILSQVWVICKYCNAIKTPIPQHIFRNCAFQRAVETSARLLSDNWTVTNPARPWLRKPQEELRLKQHVWRLLRPVGNDQSEQTFLGWGTLKRQALKRSRWIKVLHQYTVRTMHFLNINAC